MTMFVTILYIDSLQPFRSRYVNNMQMQTKVKGTCGEIFVCRWESQVQEGAI